MQLGSLMGHMMGGPDRLVEALRQHGPDALDKQTFAADRATDKLAREKARSIYGQMMDRTKGRNAVKH